MSDLKLIGYGTLLYRASIGYTVGEAAAESKELRPVLVKGNRRLFNLRPTHYEPSFKISSDPIEAAAMNVVPDPDSEFNGIVFSVTESEITALDERERYYQRCSAQIYDFETGQPMGEGYLYAATADAPWLEDDPNKLLPLWRDVVWARLGAYAISERFGRSYDHTTYLADGTTLMIDHYRRWLGEIAAPNPFEERS